MHWNILIVDDSKALRAMVRRVLSLTGLEIGEVHEAGTGQLALDMLRRLPIDIVLTDLNMPGMSGNELLEQIHSTSALSPIRVIVMTSEHAQPKLAALAQLGVRTCLIKPFSPEALRDALLALTGPAAGELHGR